MRSYLVEGYLARASQRDLSSLAARARAAASEVTAEGAPVRYVRSLLVPEDDVCFHVFEGASAEAVWAEAGEPRCRRNESSRSSSEGDETRSGLTKEGLGTGAFLV